ncbi:NADPH2:quinone reductase [Chryseobacterium ginsenosidimutans]|uniref:quinone oxidoreductase family protein n=1 Tax=Chryseobacterium ginsenosidimutans TaxID=687846 RepID=UPI00278829B2|nr:quinone oxidoreductase [Chryseobacterium ginsenosidimutans]MDQ0593850.1 NADPH2:quinone reductase [Chryseobacterium ginsenosidimutans]
MATNNESGIIRMNRQGSPSVLEYGVTTIGQPSATQVVLHQKVIALNFVDIMFRNGSFPISDFPATIGVEASGVIESAGENVTEFSVGDRVGYFFSLGAYAERRLIESSELIKLPEDVSFDQAAAIMAKGLTARMLIKQAYPVQKGDVILVHAAAGGVGSLVSRWAKALGATVIGTVGNHSKKAYAINNGIDHVIALDTDDLHEAIKKITEGKGVDVVFDGVGKATFNESLKSIKNEGTIVLFGSSSGTPDIDEETLKAKNIKLIRPALGNYLKDKASIQSAAAEMFEALRNGILGEINPTVYPLSEAAKAHQDLESGNTKGSIIFHI